MVDYYITFVKNNLILSAFIQFAVLGLIGELIGIWISKKKMFKPFSTKETVFKMIGWGILGIIIKYAFTGFFGFTNSLIENHLLNNIFKSAFLFALITSIVTNSLFGPQMMLIHRIIDNLIMKTKGYKGLKNSISTLFWFWIPAHTITFILPKHFQIGLAALWSVVLGIIMGVFKRKASEA